MTTKKSSTAKATSKSGKSKVKRPAKARSTGDDEMLPEYDLTNAVRNKYAARFSTDVHYIAIDDDVMSYFETPKAVNAALRALATALRESAVKKRA